MLQHLSTSLRVDQLLPFILNMLESFVLNDKPLTLNFSSYSPISLFPLIDMISKTFLLISSSSVLFAVCHQSKLWFLILLAPTLRLCLESHTAIISAYQFSKVYQTYHPFYEVFPYIISSKLPNSLVCTF